MSSLFEIGGALRPMLLPRGSALKHARFGQLRRFLGLFGIFVCFGLGCRAAELPADFLKSLADNDFKVRETAQASLLQWARGELETSPRLLHERYRNSEDPEVRSRCLAVLEELARDDYKDHGNGFMGIQMQDARADVPGQQKARPSVLITNVLPGMAAEKAGLMVGDLLLELNGKPIGDPPSDSIRQSIMGFKPGTKVKLKLMRDGNLMEVVVTLGRRPLAADNPLFERFPEQAEEAERRKWDAFRKQWLEDLEPEP